MRRRDVNVDQLSPAALAYVGDAVYTLHVRTGLVTAGSRPQSEMHRLASQDVRAASQARWLTLIEADLLPAEKDVVRWARNARIGKGGGGTPAERHHATAFEALLGHLFLSGQSTRLQELLDRLEQLANPAPELGG